MNDEESITDEQRAIAWLRPLKPEDAPSVASLTVSLAALLRAVREEEREACARLFEAPLAYDPNTPNGAEELEEIARWIRARGKP